MTQNSSTFEINVRALLSFFDEDRTVSRHSNSIKTLAGEELMFELLRNYLARKGFDTELVTPCNQGANQGVRLDGWIVAKKSGSNEEAIHYQVEVKSWSAHGVGCGAGFLGSKEPLSAYKMRMWNTYWANGRFKEKGLHKVLTPMRCPTESATVKPLACLWSPLQASAENEEPFFSVSPIPSEPFSEVCIFSASSFLRTLELTEPIITVDLPQTAERIRWLNTLFTRRECSA